MAAPAPAPASASASAPPPSLTETLAAPVPATPTVSATETVTVSVPPPGPFSQLMAGAMASPVVAVPCFISPGAVIESPPFSGQFAMTHQAVLATVTAQAQMQRQAANPSPPEGLSSPVLQPIATTISPVPLQQMLPSVYEGSFSTALMVQTPSSVREPQSARSAMKMNHEDGYNWRKYGQKQVKSGENSRSYYKCTNANCTAKKKVERYPDGRVNEVSYRGEHSHEPPQQTRYSRERMARSTGAVGETESVELLRIEYNETDPSTSKAEPRSSHETTEQQLFCSSDCERDAAIKTEDGQSVEPDPKRRLSEKTGNYPSPVLKTCREPRIVVQAASDVGRVSDGYRWRKYGQKTVKGNPNPRSYYRCTHAGCPVRKHVEIAFDDAKSVLISYEGTHNHELPVPKNNNDPLASLCLPPASVDTTGFRMLPAPKNNNDPLASPCLTPASVDTTGFRMLSSPCLLEQTPAADSLTDENGNITGEKSLELGDEKALEPGQVLTNRLNPPLLDETSAAVSVQNS